MMSSATSNMAAILPGLVLLLSSQSNSLCWGFQAVAPTSSAAAIASRPTVASPCATLSQSRIPSSLTFRGQACTQLHMSDNDEDTESSSSNSNVKFFELEDAFEDDGENVVGTKFFGGSTVKEELYVPEDEELALELQMVKPEDELEYKRFEDTNAFGDELAQKVGASMQAAINKILYDEDIPSSNIAWKEDSSLKWDTVLSKSKNGDSPLKELASSKSWYNKLDVAILSADTVKTEKNINQIEIRWDIGVVWPNPWESRALLTGTSTLAVRDDGDSLVLLKQVDQLDGSNPSDIVGRLSSQLNPRFWDVYHIGMTPSTEKDPRFDSPLASTKSLSTNNQGKKGLLSGYKVSYLPPRLVTEPSLVDTNGRDGRAAQSLPNHGFTTAIKTMGPNKEVFAPVSPIEIGISKVEGVEKGSFIKWSVPVPPEFASKAVLPLPVIDEEEDADEGADADEEKLATSNRAKVPAKEVSPYTPGRTNKPPPTPPQSLACSYSLRPSRLVATLPYAGNPQDEEVTQLRRQLYQEVVERDGYKPKLDPVTGRPIFFFWMNDAKACFTRAGGLGMAVYEWRADWSKSNEVGIELEC